jgi:hypothetical protein
MAMEKKVLVISRNALADFERRVSGKFITFGVFLAVLILLNCVENSSWLHESWKRDYLNAQ